MSKVPEQPDCRRRAEGLSCGEPADHEGLCRDAFSGREFEPAPFSLGGPREDKTLCAAHIDLHNTVGIAPQCSSKATHEIVIDSPECGVRYGDGPFEPGTEYSRVCDDHLAVIQPTKWFVS